MCVLASTRIELRTALVKLKRLIPKRTHIDSFQHPSRIVGLPACLPVRTIAPRIDRLQPPRQSDFGEFLQMVSRLRQIARQLRTPN